MPIIPTRATLLSTPLGELHDWSLLVWCACRRFPCHLAVRRLAEERGSLVKLEAILGRMRCESCGGPPVKAEAKQGDPFAPRVAAIVLLETRGRQRVTGDRSSDHARPDLG